MANARRPGAMRGRVALFTLSPDPAVADGVAGALGRARLDAVAPEEIAGGGADMVLIDARGGDPVRAARAAEALAAGAFDGLVAVALSATDAAIAAAAVTRIRNCADLVIAGSAAHRPVAARCQALIRFRRMADEVEAQTAEAGADRALRETVRARARPRVLIAAEPHPRLLALFNTLTDRGAAVEAAFTPSQAARTLEAHDPDCIVIQPTSPDDPFSAVVALVRTDAQYAVRPVIAFGDAADLDAAAVHADWDHAAPDSSLQGAADAVAAWTGRTRIIDGFAKYLKSVPDADRDPETDGALSSTAFARRWERVCGDRRSAPSIGLLRASAFSLALDGAVRGAATRSLSALLKAHVRAYDALGRLSDDVFAVAFPATGEDDAGLAMERLAAILRRAAPPTGAPAGLFSAVDVAWASPSPTETPAGTLLRALRSLNDAGRGRRAAP